jgi:hypothetical protein
MSERSGGRDRKDRMVQARIPEQLDRELRNRAQRLGISVSTVVRNALLHTFDLVEGLVTDSAQIARALGESGRSRSADASRKRPLSRDADRADPGIVGWQDLTLHRNAVCEDCNAVLERGARAAIGVPSGARPVVLCSACLAALSSPARERPEGARARARTRGPRVRSRPKG